MHVAERVGQFFVNGARLEYTDFAPNPTSGPWADPSGPTLVLTPPALLSRRFQLPLARALAADGVRVFTLDPLGHGRSDRPDDPRLHSTTEYAGQVLALLDHVDVPRAVVGGTALGAGVALEVAAAAPDRVVGLLLDAPVLDNALLPALGASLSLIAVARFAPLTVAGTRLTTRLVPRGLVPFEAGLLLDSFNQRPAPLAATLHGIRAGRLAPPADVRREIAAPALVVGHGRDPWHPVSDARLLHDDLADSELVEFAGPWRRVRSARLHDAVLRLVLERADHATPARRLTAD